MLLKLKKIFLFIKAVAYYTHSLFRYRGYRSFLKKIQPSGILRVKLEKDLRLEPAYEEYYRLLEQHPLRKQMSQLSYQLSLRFVLKYDKFMQHTAAYSMCMPTQMYNIIDCVEQALHDNIPGDLFEAGSWKGGMGILMKEILRRHDNHERQVWLADAWGQEFPAAVTDNDLDISPILNRLFVGSVTRDSVESNFREFLLYDDKVNLIEGYFKYTLPNVAVDSIAVLRLDADLYNSTMDALNHLYAKVSAGGYIIVDDYGIELCDCKQAIHDFRDKHGINDPIHMVDLQCAYWRKSK